MKLDRLKQLVGNLSSAVAAIQTEIDTAERKGVFAYPRSKAIRKEALEIAKDAKNVREACLQLYKAEGGNSDEE